MAAEHPFVSEVRAALGRMDDDRAQDQLDVLMHGGTVPPEPIPTADPKCINCGGTGQVCSCHGIEWAWSRTDHGADGPEKCYCVRQRPVTERDSVAEHEGARDV